MSISESAGFSSAIPIITCPSCGSRLQLRMIVPDTYQQDRMIFDCKCGFEYQLSSRAASEQKM